MSSPDPWELGRFDGIPEKHPRNSSLGAHKWHLLANQFLGLERGPPG